MKKIFDDIEKEHNYYMKEALKQAKKAYDLGEVPIGCVIVYDGQIIGRGYNRRNTDKSVLCHAEISAMKKAGKIIKDWRLEDCTLYVTLEPCQMCAGAIVQARIPKVVIGCQSQKSGCGGTILNILENPDFKRLFINNACILLNSYLTYEKVQSTVQSMMATIPSSEQQRDEQHHFRQQQV